MANLYHVLANEGAKMPPPDFVSNMSLTFQQFHAYKGGKLVGTLAPVLADEGWNGHDVIAIRCELAGVKKAPPCHNDWPCFESLQPKKEFGGVFAAEVPKITGVKTSVMFEAGPVLEVWGGGPVLHLGFPCGHGLGANTLLASSANMCTKRLAPGTTKKPKMAVKVHNGADGAHFSPKFPISYSVSLYGKRVPGMFGFAFREADGLGGVRALPPPPGISTQAKCPPLRESVGAASVALKGAVAAGGGASGGKNGGASLGSLIKLKEPREGDDSRADDLHHGEDAPQGEDDPHHGGPQRDGSEGDDGPQSDRSSGFDSAGLRWSGPRGDGGDALQGVQRGNLHHGGLQRDGSEGDGGSQGGVGLRWSGSQVPGGDSLRWACHWCGCGCGRRCRIDHHRSVERNSSNEERKRAHRLPRHSRGGAICQAYQGRQPLQRDWQKIQRRDAPAHQSTDHRNPRQGGSKAVAIDCRSIYCSALNNTLQPRERKFLPKNLSFSR